ncbi:GroES chaperonin, partial [Trifolium medium]|nr:GroES chaperonin [Trifolium medium]
YTTIKPLGDRVLLKIKEAEEKTQGGILLPSNAQTKPQGGEVVAVGEGKTPGKNQVENSVKPGAQVVYSKYAGTEVDFNGEKHLILKDDDIVGILETDDIKDLKPLNDRVLIQIEKAEEKTAGGLFLTQATKEKPSFGTNNMLSTIGIMVINCGRGCGNNCSCCYCGHCGCCNAQCGCCF